MSIHPYLFFNGNCAEAMSFYQQVLGGTLSIMRFSEIPEFEKHFSTEFADHVAHARLDCEGHILMASDSCPEQPAGIMDGFSVSLNFDDTDHALGVFRQLSEKGEVFMPWEATFWTEGFGMFKDKYGVAWMVNGQLKQGIGT